MYLAGWVISLDQLVFKAIIDYTKSRDHSLIIHMWLDFGKPTELSHWAYSILLAQLMATLIHYTFTLSLPGLVDWSAFLERLLPTL